MDGRRKLTKTLLKRNKYFTLYIVMFNMTKYLDYAILSVAFLAILPSCTSTSSEPDEPGSANELKFAVVEDTRASLVTNTTIRNESFAVYGDMKLTSSSDTPTVIFDGTEVAYNNGSWGYANVQYWFPLHTYSFVALHPYSALQTNISDINFGSSNLSFTYNYPDNYSDAVDLLTATHRRSYTTGAGHAVAFDFSHIMARLNFVIKIDQSLGSSVKITHLSLKNIGQSASYSISPAVLQSGETNDYIGGTWTDPTDKTKTLFDISYDDVAVQSGTSYEFFPAETNPLLIIPQNVSANVEVEVTFQKDGDTSPTTASAQLYTTTVTAHNGVWQRGRTYTYTFSIGDNNYIVFGEPTLQDWNDAEGGNYIISN